MIPYSIARALNLPISGSDSIGGVGGSGPTDIYIGDVKLFGVDFTNYPLYRWPQERDFVLIGRDLLKRYIIKLDGPSQAFSVL
jgi:hypothetical protein